MDELDAEGGEGREGDGGMTISPLAWGTAAMPKDIAFTASLGYSVPVAAVSRVGEMPDRAVKAAAVPQAAGEAVVIGDGPMVMTPPAEGERLDQEEARA